MMVKTNARYRKDTTLGKQGKCRYILIPMEATLTASLVQSLSTLKNRIIQRLFSPRESLQIERIQLKQIISPITTSESKTKITAPCPVERDETQGKDLPGKKFISAAISIQRKISADSNINTIIPRSSRSLPLPSIGFDGIPSMEFRPIATNAEVMASTILLEVDIAANELSS
mmetsp:Transcript_28295/g.34520  ORF Transcript_28295/g.34520 Transcript_28295/m.34520 type:complete len:173 (-) Transcript_28295:608-1126(-)